MVDRQTDYLLRCAHKLLERSKLQTRLAISDLQEKSIQLWACFEGLYEKLEVREVEVAPTLCIRLLYPGGLLRTYTKREAHPGAHGRTLNRLRRSSRDGLMLSFLHNRSTSAKSSCWSCSSSAAFQNCLSHSACRMSALTSPLISS